MGLKKDMRQHNKKRRLNEESKIKHSKEMCLSVSGRKKTSRLAKGQARAKEKSPSRKSVNERSSRQAQAGIKGDLESGRRAYNSQCNDDDDDDNT